MPQSRNSNYAPSSYFRFLVCEYVSSIHLTLNDTRSSTSEIDFNQGNANAYKYAIDQFIKFNGYGSGILSGLTKPGEETFMAAAYAVARNLEASWDGFDFDWNFAVDVLCEWLRVRGINMKGM